ncbi:MAG: tRNA 2-thiocytidine biosynthesis protein TtcA [Clostridiales bacterium]|nr:tRNA 2-thiocytidine biosynthesis protein TtcA [Clostridiales bacterium]
MRLQKLLSYVRRAVDDYNMINDNDKIAVGVSGGKDSLALLIALKALQRFYPKKFEIEAVSVSLGFKDMDFSPIQKLCDNIDVKYTLIETDIGEIIFNARKEKNPCSLCSKMRKGALNDAVEGVGFNKVALGHNRDDVIETFFMSMFYEGRIYTFSPVTFLDRKKIYSIRPLMYVPEKELIGFARKEELPVVKNKCPADGETKRENIKNFVREQSLNYDHFEEKIFGGGVWRQ